jgi:hypothetical protein
MAGVMASLIPRDYVEMSGKQVNNLTLTFVSPLGADDY